MLPVGLPSGSYTSNKKGAAAAAVRAFAAQADILRATLPTADRQAARTQNTTQSKPQRARPRSSANVSHFPSIDPTVHLAEQIVSQLAPLMELLQQFISAQSSCTTPVVVQRPLDPSSNVSALIAQPALTSPKRQSSRKRKVRRDSASEPDDVDAPRTAAARTSRDEAYEIEFNDVFGEGSNDMSSSVVPPTENDKLVVQKPVPNSPKRQPSRKRKVSRDSASESDDASATRTVASPRIAGTSAACRRQCSAPIGPCPAAEPARLSVAELYKSMRGMSDHGIAQVQFAGLSQAEARMNGLFSRSAKPTTVLQARALRTSSPAQSSVAITGRSGGVIGDSLEVALDIPIMVPLDGAAQLEVEESSAALAPLTQEEVGRRLLKINECLDFLDKHVVVISDRSCSLSDTPMEGLEEWYLTDRISMSEDGRIPTVEPVKKPLYGVEIWDLTTEYDPVGIALDRSDPAQREVLEVLAAIPMEARLDWRMTRVSFERLLWLQQHVDELAKANPGSHEVQSVIERIKATAAADAACPKQTVETCGRMYCMVS